MDRKGKKHLANSLANTSCRSIFAPLITIRILWNDYFCQNNDSQKVDVFAAVPLFCLLHLTPSYFVFSFFFSLPLLFPYHSFFHSLFSCPVLLRWRIFQALNTKTTKLNQKQISVRSSTSHFFIVQELCESRGGRPELSVLTTLLVSVDVKNYWTMLRHWSQLVPNMTTDIWGH